MMRTLRCVFVFCAIYLVSVIVHATPAATGSLTYQVKYIDHGNGQYELISKKLSKNKFGHGEKRYPQFFAEHQPVSKSEVVELYGVSQKQVEQVLSSRKISFSQKKQHTDPATAEDEVVTLVSNGPVDNRIDFVFMGDGYTANEREKFFADTQRLVHQMFDGDTLKSYLPIFNVHAVFRPSRESGIGRNSRPKDTAYKLYRDGVTLRAIYPGNPAAARSSCQAAPDCDYPILVANDPYYGGLGGEFSITTSSDLSGIIVLRHELGHSVGIIGEEYDGGGYFGANHSSSLQNLSWKHWLSGPIREEPSKARFIGWPWHNLQNGPFVANFKSDGQQSFSAIRFSASGIATDHELKVILDGQELPFTSPNSADRVFHDISRDEGFSSDNHKLIFTEQVADGDNWVSSLTVHEYGQDYHFDNNYIGAYPLEQSAGNKNGYRPTHEGCLMRDMNFAKFCAVCQENNWLQFFEKMDMIDGVTVTGSENEVSVTLSVPELGQFRQVPIDGEEVKIKWLQDGREVLSLAGKTAWTLPASQVSGQWEVDVEFVTPEVKKDSEHLLHKRVAVNM